MYRRASGSKTAFLVAATMAGMKMLGADCSMIVFLSFEFQEDVHAACQPARRIEFWR
jgi:hypothetical protein